MSIDRRMDKEDVVYICVRVFIMEYFSAIKKNEIMPFTATWMGLEIILSKPNRKYISLIC